MASVKLLTLNIEYNRHLDRVRSFIDKERPEVWCVQEILTKEIETFKKEFGYSAVSIPTIRRPRDRENESSPITTQHTAIFSTLPISDQSMEYYYTIPEQDRLYDDDNKRATVNQGLISCTVTKDSVPFHIATTHFTVTKDGLPDKDQEEDTESLLRLLDAYPEVVLCGDFNIPRHHNELYGRFIERYKDNIPEEYTGSLDLSLHRKGNHPTIGPEIAKYMVDYIFSTPEYTVSDVVQHCGISDHCGFTANVSKE